MGDGLRSVIQVDITVRKGQRIRRFPKLGGTIFRFSWYNIIMRMRLLGSQRLSLAICFVLPGRSVQGNRAFPRDVRPASSIESQPWRWVGEHKARLDSGNLRVKIRRRADPEADSFIFRAWLRERGAVTEVTDAFREQGIQLLCSTEDMTRTVATEGFHEPMNHTPVVNVRGHSG